MAPIATADLVDGSGYTPSYDNLQLVNDRLGHAKLRTRVGLSNKILESDETSKYYCHLLPEDIKAIEQAVANFRDSKLPISSISRKTFHLPDFVLQKLAGTLEKVHGSQGFAIIDGLEPHRYYRSELVIIHVGLMAHMGGKRAMPGQQGGDKTVLHHVVHLPQPTQSGVYHGPPNENREMPFHTDDGDITSLFMVNKSAHQSGGSLYLANATKVFETMRSTWPKNANALEEDWPFPGHDGVSVDFRPVVFQQPGEKRILINCSRARLTGTQTSRRSHTLPTLTEMQRCTLDLLHGISMQQAVRVDMQLGDLLLFDNLGMLHARDSFFDETEAGATSKRHLLRLIVQDDARIGRVPAQLRPRWECLFEHDADDEVFPVDVERFGISVSH